MARAHSSSGKRGKYSSTKGTPAAATPQRRQSQRLSSSATKSSTPKKSIYFDHGSGDGDDGDDASSVGYQEEEETVSATSPEPSEEASISSDDGDSRKRKRSAPKTTSPISRKAAKGSELWREGVKSHLAPGEEVVIALPKAREAGKTPYREETIHPNTLLFLGDLKRNNERPWLKLHDKDFRQSEKDWKGFVDQMTEKMTDVDDTLPELPAKDIVFRIYRDVRFSSDPTPYKPHFSGCWSRTGRKGPYAAYYLQIAPGKSFIGGGLWCPEAQYLVKLRRNFDRHSEHVKSILALPQIREEFLGGAIDDKKALKAFLAHNADNALKRHPKGYDEENPNIGLLRLRSFTMGRKLSDNEVTNPKSLEKLVKIMSALTPFVTYLNGVVMPDNPEESDDSDTAGDA